MILSNIHSPQDVKSVPEAQLSDLAAEIRKKILAVVAKNGGHLASNLGVVELTIALHRVFDSPNDAIIFDVSHQCYAHKLLTGRADAFSTLRTRGGISGFTRHKESPHDFFDNGHASTSISQALGLLTAWEAQGRRGKVVAVIGDGALTGGMAFEALSHAGQLAKNLIVVLNDNKMSIGPNTGALSRYLSRATMSRTYQGFRRAIDRVVEAIPNSRRHLGKAIFRLKRGLKGMFLTDNLFTDLGFEYVGPLDGHNIRELEAVLRRVSRLPRPVVVHIRTKKGKGYSPAENDPASFHGIGPFTISDGKMDTFDSMGFTEAFSSCLLSIAQRTPRLVAITAAMAKGTGLDAFARHYAERFFDVGIAEEHAVTFAAGLARGGMIPVVAIYSTFMQRSIDQIIHDVALPSLAVVLVLDRAGAVPNDGETHQGVFDIALLRPVPNLAVLCPASAADLALCMEWAIANEGPVALRYPKLSCPSEVAAFSEPVTAGRGVLVRCSDFAPTLVGAYEAQTADDEAESDSPRTPTGILFACTGGMYSETLQAARALLLDGLHADIYCLRFIKPLDEDYFIRLTRQYAGVVLVEDGVQTGGIGEHLQLVLARAGMTNTAVKAFPDTFLLQGSRAQVLNDARLSAKELAAAARALLPLPADSDAHTATAVTDSDNIAHTTATPTDGNDAVPTTIAASDGDNDAHTATAATGSGNIAHTTTAATDSGNIAHTTATPTDSDDAVPTTIAASDNDNDAHTATAATGSDNIAHTTATPADGNDAVSTTIAASDNDNDAHTATAATDSGSDAHTTAAASDDDNDAHTATAATDSGNIAHTTATPADGDNIVAVGSSSTQMRRV